MLQSTIKQCKDKIMPRANNNRFTAIVCKPGEVDLEDIKKILNDRDCKKVRITIEDLS